jgi:hypothetical protein
MLRGIVREPGLEHGSIAQDRYALAVVGPPLRFFGKDLDPGPLRPPKRLKG